MHQLTDTKGEYTSVSLPLHGVLQIGQPLINVSLEALREELAQFYGDRIQIIESEAKPPQPSNRKRR